MPSAGERETERERERAPTLSLGWASVRDSLGENLSSAAFLFPVRVVCTVSLSPDEHRSSQTRGRKEAAERSRTGWRRSEIIVAQLVPWPHRAHVIVYNVRSRPKWRKKILDNNLLPALPHSVRIFHFQKLRLG